MTDLFEVSLHGMLYLPFWENKANILMQDTYNIALLFHIPFDLIKDL